LFRCLVGLGFGALFSVNALAGFSSEVGLELRYFPTSGISGQDQFQPSVRGELEYSESGDDNSFEVVIFGRADKEDSERSHVDLREAAWTHVGDSFELKAGVSKVFWGVTESRHLVDVINQSDIVENVDGEDKLGQLMTKVSFERDWGTLDLFWLPYFRERTFPGIDGRLRAPLPIRIDDAQYQSGAKRWHSDAAIRYSHYIDDLEFAISHFSGTSREPILIPGISGGAPVLTPLYTTVDQTGLEVQYLWEEWIFKLEGISNSGMTDRYSAAVAGFEYTQVGIFDSNADLGWIAEYLFDDRKNNAPHSFERDIFVAWRYAFNDADSSEILGGMIYDPKTHEKVLSVEVSQRVASDLKLNIEGRIFENGRLPAQANDKNWFLEDEDYIQLELVKYF